MKSGSALSARIQLISSRVAGFFSTPRSSRSVVKGVDAGLRQIIAQIGEMDTQDPPHHLLVGKGDVMEIAPAQEGIGEVLLGVGGNDDDRPVFRLDRSCRSP